LRQFIVFGLREQVDRHPVRIGRGIGDDQHLRRAGHHVDADHAEHAALGGGDIGVAGADDLVHLRHRLRAVGQRRHGLGATDGEYAVHTGQAGRGQHQRVLLAARRRHHHDQFADAGHLGWQRIHQHRTRIGRLAAGYIEADAVERRHLLSQARAVGSVKSQDSDFCRS
jgi:hypothetical protein